MPSRWQPTALALVCLLSASPQARAALKWRWSYSGSGIMASGTFTTADTPNGDGFYLITAISGSVDGATITTLTPPGTAIPNNPGYPVDNLVSPLGQQLTKSGFGFSAANRESANPFHLDGHYVVFISHADGTTAEPAVSFHAAIVREPDPAAPPGGSKRALLPRTNP